MEQNEKIFFPRCLNNTRYVAYAATGYLLPCCWTDGVPDFFHFYDESLYIDNNETVEDILNSKTWQEFYHMLENEPDRAPALCKRQCTQLKTNPTRDRIRLGEN